MRNGEERDPQSRERMKFVLQDLESGGGRSWRQVGLERVVLTTIKVERERITFLDLRGQKEIVEGRGWCQIWGKVEPFSIKKWKTTFWKLGVGYLKISFHIYE